jgi:N-acyl amino acid synthase of PEP-CTERM/exosortase system
MSNLASRTSAASLRSGNEMVRSLRVPANNSFNRDPDESLAPWRPPYRDDGFPARNYRHFSTVFADSPALLDAAHALRFQVYCRERNFENPNEHPEGRETDAYDTNSIQGVLFHRSMCAAIGTVRVILPKGVVKDDSFPIMPILRANSLDLSDYVDVARSIEVSRFAISKEFRLRKVGKFDTSTYTQPASNRETDLAFFSLLQFSLRESLKRRLLFWTAVMEPKFLRLLTRYGISYTSIGPTVEHHGIRQPCFGYIPETLDHVRHMRPDCWELLTQADAPWLDCSQTRKPASLSNPGLAIR